MHIGRHRRFQGRWEQIVPVFALLTIPALCLANPILEYESGLATGSPVVRPSAIAFAVDGGVLCVTDEASRTLDVFDVNGFHRFRTTPAAGIVSPRDGSIDAEGRFVYIEADGRARNELRRLNFLGEPESYEATAPTEDWTPLHLLIAGDGNYLTVDAEGALTKHDAATGEVHWRLPLVDASYERADLTGRPAQSPTGTIYVPLTGLRQIAVIGPDGEFEGLFGVPGTKSGELAFPVGVAVTGSGQILVLDRMRHRILIYSKEQAFLGESGTIGYGPGHLYHPLAIAASVDGRVYVAQGFEGRIQRFRLLGSEFARKDSES